VQWVLFHTPTGDDCYHRCHGGPLGGDVRCWGDAVLGTSSSTGSSAACKYEGKKATVSLAVTAFGDVAGAHAQIRGTAHGVALTSFHVGQEAVVYPGGIKFRTATLVVTITAVPAPSTAALETAAMSASTRL
jgi:hypothetical protein